MRRMKHRGLVSAAAVAVLLGAMAAGATAEAHDPSQGIDYTQYDRRLLQLDVQAGVHWFGLGAETGLRLNVPLMGNIGAINNALFFTFGADFYWVNVHGDGYGVAVGIPLTLKWEVFFGVLSLFAEAGANIFFDPNFISDNTWEVSSVGSWIIAAAGLRVHFSPNVALLLRVGSPYSSLGLTFSF